MFPFHQSNKQLVFQISSNPDHQKQKHTLISSQDHRINLGHASSSPDARTAFNYNDINMGKNRPPRRRKSALTTALDHHDIIQNSKENKKKKMMMHRDNERQRRQEMATLYVSLRSQLPLEFIKGKRSISDHMNEAVNYIRHLQKRIERLEGKRNELKKPYNYDISGSTDHDEDHHGGTTSTTTGSSNTNTRCSPIRPNCSSSFTINPSCGGLQIVISRGLREEYRLPLSRVLQILLQQGLNVVTYVSSRVNHKIILHTIHSEVDDLQSLNLSGLEQKLAQLFNIASSTCMSK